MTHTPWFVTHARDKKHHHIYDTVIQELLLTLGLLVGFLSLWLRRERALEDPQQSWPSESSSGPCEINDTYTTDNNPDHRSHHQGAVKSMIHIQLTTILTIGIIIRALSNNKTHTTGKQSWPSKSSSGPCEINNYTHNWQQCWPSESSSGPCQITKHMTSNNPDHLSRNWGPVKSTIHIQLTTMLTIRVIIGALWNQQYIYNWQQCWLSKLSSGPCQTTKHAQLTTAITIKVNNHTCCRSASLTIIITIKGKPHLLWTTQLPSSQQFHVTCCDIHDWQQSWPPGSTTTPKGQW